MDRFPFPPLSGLSFPRLLSFKYKGLFQSLGHSQSDRNTNTHEHHGGTSALVDRQTNAMTDKETFTKPSRYVSQRCPAPNDKLLFTTAPNAVHFQAESAMHQRLSPGTQTENTCRGISISLPHM